MAKKIGKTGKIVLVTLLVVAILALSGFGIFAIWANNTNVLAGTGIKVIAHRGLSGNFTENTATAFIKASEAPEIYGIETDVHVTKDKVLVCNHDTEVHYQDGSDLVIADNTFATLSEKFVKSKFDAKEKLTLFSDYLKACKSGSKHAIIELKVALTKEQLLQTFADVDLILGRENITIISFLFDQLELARSIDATLPSMYLVATAFGIDRAKNNGYSIGAQYALVTAPMVKAFHKKGLEVNAWTCNSKISYASMKIAGADYITTDYIPYA